jgi:hypothetical protein
MLLRLLALVRTDVWEELSAANIVPSSPLLVILMMEAQSSSETSVRTRATRRNVPEDGIVHKPGRWSVPFTHPRSSHARRASILEYTMKVADTLRMEGPLCWSVVRVTTHWHDSVHVAFLGHAVAYC